MGMKLGYIAKYDLKLNPHLWATTYKTLEAKEIEAWNRRADNG